MEKFMKNDDIKIIGGGLFQVKIELSDEIQPPSQHALDMIERNKEQIEYLKTIKKSKDVVVSSENLKKNDKIESLVGVIRDTGMTLEDYRAERLAKYESLD